MQLSQLGKPIILEMEFLDPYTDEKTGVFVKFHSLKSRHGKESLHSIQLKIIEAKEKNEEIDNKVLNKQLLLDLFDSFRGLEDENGKVIKSSIKAFEDAIDESQEFFNACLVFVSNSGNSLKKSEKDL
jgi:hypothetical protein